jgi:Tfp pilus assembly protein PilX
MNLPSTRSQRGVALVVGLIMLVLITVMLIAALNIGTANFRAVSNMQFREEAIGAANRAIDQVISSNFTAAPAAEEVIVDVDNDGDTDYAVQVAQPQCVTATPASSADPSSKLLPPAMTIGSTWNTVWDLQATVDSADANNVGGAAVVVRAGVRTLLTEAQKNVVCPP